jgi:isocitrate/isopropylmalate dehydrogenase
MLGAIEALLSDPHAPRTADLGGSAGTVDVGRAITDRISAA